MYLCIGKYVSTHGIKGEIRISLNDFLLLDKKKMTILSREDVVNILFKKNDIIFIGDKKEPFIITGYRHHKSYEMLTFEGINNINQILFLKKEKCYVSNNIIDDLFISLESLKEFKVLFNSKSVGIIIDYQNNNGNILLEVEGSKKFYIPINPYFIKEIDEIDKSIKAINIEGLMLWE